MGVFVLRLEGFEDGGAVLAFAVGGGGAEAVVGGGRSVRAICVGVWV